MKMFSLIFGNDSFALMFGVIAENCSNYLDNLHNSMHVRNCLAISKSYFLGMKKGFLSENCVNISLFTSFILIFFY